MELDKIYIEHELKELDIDYDGTEMKIKVKPISWSKKNQILSQCFTYQTDGKIAFNFDRYLKEMLSNMIVEAPWGETNHIFLNKIKPDFGQQLERLVPKAFEEMQNPDFFAQE